MLWMIIFWWIVISIGVATLIDSFKAKPNRSAPLSVQESIEQEILDNIQMAERVQIDKRANEIYIEKKAQKQADLYYYP